MKKIFLSLLFFILAFGAFAQDDRFMLLEQKLRALSAEAPGLNENIELSVNGVSLQEFIRGIAVSNNLNVNVDPAVNVRVVNNFTNVSVTDVFLFLCRKYNLDITFIGSIMSFTTYNEPKEVPVIIPKSFGIAYDKEKDIINFDLNNDTLSSVAHRITSVTDKNIILTPDVRNKIVSGYFKNLSFKQALEKLALSNDLKVTAEDNIFIIDKQDKEEQRQIKGEKGKQQTNLPSGLLININDKKLISVDAVNVPMTDIVSNVCKQLGINYFLFADLKGNSTLFLKDYTFESFLKYILNGTDFTYRFQDSIYLIGDRNLEGLRTTRLIQMKYRTVEKITDFIPPDLKKGVDVKIFSDQNSLILSGSTPRIQEIENFLRDIDKVVPVVYIEVIIITLNDKKTLETAIEAGLKSGVTTGGTVFPNYDMTYNATSVNNIIDKINKYGAVNLGKVTPNFYVNLKALETQGYLKIKSTPKLSTLNGHEATMTIGETQYYTESQNNVIGSQNPQNIVTQQYKPLNADMKLTVNPLVSGDDQITLSINFSNSSFTARISQTAPPGSIKRDFQSMVRVKNEETVVLGGLDENQISDSGTGVPFLSRIPVIKWLFSSRNRVDSKSKLTIFIKPTVIY